MAIQTKQVSGAEAEAMRLEALTVAREILNKDKFKVAAEVFVNAKFSETPVPAPKATL